MSHRIPNVEVPRDLSMAQELRRQITRNSAEISLSFWQQFESIRDTQRNRMAGETLRRERISTLMRDGQQEANKEAEALSRSISVQGMMTLPMAMAENPPQSALMTSIVQGIKSIESLQKPVIKQVPSSLTKFKTKAKTNKEPAKSLPGSANKGPRISGISKASSVSTASSSKSTPNISKMRLNKKTKK